MCVICFHFPVGPAQTSGGVLAACITMPATDPSRETEIPGTGADEVAPIICSLDQSFSAAPPRIFTVAMLESPSAFCVNRILSADVQVRAEGEEEIPGVRFFSAPPASGMS